jgi:hypothetical protein
MKEWELPGTGGSTARLVIGAILYCSTDGLLKFGLKALTLLETMATESGRLSPPKLEIWGRGEWDGRRGGSLGSIAASLCLRSASSWASAFCLRLMLGALDVLILFSEDRLRRKEKLDLRAAAAWKSPFDVGAADGSGEPSLV